MALRVGKLYVKLEIDDRDFQRGLQRAEQEIKKTARSLNDLVKKIDSFGKSLKDVGDKLTTRVTLPLAAATAGIIKMASSAEQTEEKFRVSFGEMAQASLQLADQLARDQQRARVAIQNMMADAQAILAPMTENREAAARMSAALAALAVDLGSFMNMADREAFDRLISGLLGSTEATERLGISLRESVLQLEAQRLGLEANVATLGDAEKIMLRFSAIMRQSADAQTDAIRTGASFENQLKALQADIADLAAEMGQELLPYALALVQVGRDLVQHWRSLSPEAKELAFQIAALAAAAGPLALGLSAIVRAGAGVGRVLALIATVSRRHPLVLLASLATMAALSVEEVRVKLNELGRAIGLGDLLDQLEDLQEAFQDLMSFEIDFDPEGASAEALERQKQLYQQAMEEIQRTLREGFAGAAEAADEGAEALVERATQALVRLAEEERRILQARRLMASLRGEGPIEQEVLEDWLRAQEQALEELYLAGANLPDHPAHEAFQLLQEDMRRTAEQLRALRAEIEQAELDEELARQAQEGAARFHQEIEAVRDRLLIDLYGAFRGGGRGAVAFGRAIAEAMGESWTAVDELDAKIRSVLDAIEEWRRLGYIKTVFDLEAEGLLDELRQLSTELRDARFGQELARINRELAQTFDQIEVERLLAAVTGEEFDEAAARWRAVERAIWDVVRAGHEHGRTIEEILPLVEQLVSEYGHLAQRVHEASDPLAALREQLHFDLGPGMAIQRLISPAFDELQYEIDRLTRFIQSSIQALNPQTVGQFMDAVGAEVEQLQELLRRQEEQLRVQDAVNSALDGFAQGLADGNRVVQDFMRLLRWEQGGLRFDVGGLWSLGANLLGQLIGGLFGGSHQRQPEPRTFEAPDPYTYGLAIASGQRSELEAEIRRLEERLRQAQAAYDYLFRDALNAWWHSNFRQDLVRERQAAVELARQELENARRAYEAFDLSSFLGLDPGNIARAVESGFDMADMSRLGQSLEDVIRTALVRAWVTSEEMVRLQTRFRDLLQQVVDEFVQHGELRADALDPLRAVIAAIQERGEAFNEVLRRLGFTTEQLNEQFSRLVYNIPQGYRVERAIFEAAPPRIPALAAGGIVTRPTLALVGEAGPEAVVPLDRGFGRSEVHVHFHGPVYGMDDFDRRVEQSMQRANRRLGLRDTGNPVGWRGRR